MPARRRSDVCFSTEADFAAAALLTPIAVLSLRAAPTRRHLPIAALPAVFAAHQFIEGFVWLRFDGHVSPGVSDAAIHVYLVIAQVLLPLLVPIGMALIERDRRRRWVMLACAAVGALTAARFAWIIFAHDVGATEQDHVIVYRTDIHIGVWATLGYVLATCASVLATSNRLLLNFGIANVVGLAIAAAVRYEAVTSVWCVYAALVSWMVLLAMRADRRRAPPTATRSGSRPNPAPG
ncbi:MAG: hypothetical protein Q7T55_20285 [Solirubrobacteraceae bacterium]|nr:hypothetical protein [Solirubrobacteraceae bacterium]